MPGMTYEENEIYLAPGESVLFHSDGLVEAHDPRRDVRLPTAPEGRKEQHGRRSPMRSASPSLKSSPGTPGSRRTTSPS